MHVMDRINAEWGKGTLTVAATGLEKKCFSRRSHRSTRLYYEMGGLACRQGLMRCVPRENNPPLPEWSTS